MMLNISHIFTFDLNGIALHGCFKDIWEMKPYARCVT